MPRIFDNIKLDLGDALRASFAQAYSADICVGYFNLRGWDVLSDLVDRFVGGESLQCRLLVGRNITPADEVRWEYEAASEPAVDRRTTILERNALLESYHQQLIVGGQSEQQLRSLRLLRRHMREGKVRIKMHARGALHAKLYILHRHDPDNPRTAFLGSSNLTLSGLRGSGELNIDVLDHDATETLHQWFEDRWNDQFCIDITEELIGLIDRSWATADTIPPYHIYLKMVHHISRQAREGINSFSIPQVFREVLLEFQQKAVQIAAQYLHERRGVLIGDVVGLGKTLMASALVKIMRDDCNFRALIICPPNLTDMWREYESRYDLGARVMSISRVQNELHELPGLYQVVLIDESHNLRNRDGKRYAAIRDFINQNDSRCILISATPYNKTYRDLSNQLRLFVDEKADLGIRPEEFLREYDGGGERFALENQKDPRTLEAFEHSEHSADWRQLISLFMVRRTRSFIKKNYAKRDPNGDFFLEFSNGGRARFPNRRALRVNFNSNADDPDDRYARLYSESVVDVITDLHLPRYGLGNYVDDDGALLNREEQTIVKDLTTGGRRLIGFSRTNLFKRLESSGTAFLLSIERHVARNRVFLHALENDLPLPVGPQDASMLYDTRIEDADPNAEDYSPDATVLYDEEISETGDLKQTPDNQDTGDSTRQHRNKDRDKSEQQDDPRSRAARTYEFYRSVIAHKFRWLRADVFTPELALHLRRDCEALEEILMAHSPWQARHDNKLHALRSLLLERHADQKVLVFSQFADTIEYLEQELRSDLPEDEMQAVSGRKGDPGSLARRFSPKSNSTKHKNKQNSDENDSQQPVNNDDQNSEKPSELRVLLATDMLSEGQNLQDAHIVVNYDLPWAIIRLIQRAGRVDRIGQEASNILCYTFWPADGIEKIISLRSRLSARLDQNAQVVGADELFFDDQKHAQPLHDLYNESTGILDEEDDDDNDLVSQALGVWDAAVKDNPKLKQTIERLPDKVFSAKAVQPQDPPAGLLAYIQIGSSSYGLVRLDAGGNIITEAYADVLRAAECLPDEPAVERAVNHFDLVSIAENLLTNKQGFREGQLGPPRAIRRRIYEKVKYMIDGRQANDAVRTDDRRSALEAVLQALYRAPLREQARQSIARQLRAKIDETTLADMLIELHDNGRLVRDAAPRRQIAGRIICSLGLNNV